MVGNEFDERGGVELTTNEKLVLEMYRYAMDNGGSVSFWSHEGASFTIPGIGNVGGYNLESALKLIRHIVAERRFVGIMKNKVYPHIGMAYKKEPYDDGLMQYAESEKIFGRGK